MKRRASHTRRASRMSPPLPPPSATDCDASRLASRNPRTPFIPGVRSVKLAGRGCGCRSRALRRHRGKGRRGPPSIRRSEREWNRLSRAGRGVRKSGEIETAFLVPGHANHQIMVSLLLIPCSCPPRGVRAGLQALSLRQADAQWLAGLTVQGRGLRGPVRGLWSCSAPWRRPGGKRVGEPRSERSDQTGPGRQAGPERGDSVAWPGPAVLPVG